MTFLIRFILVGIIIYLIVRSFARYFEEHETDTRKHEKGNRDNGKTKGVSKEIGEYVDYEEID